MHRISRMAFAFLLAWAVSPLGALAQESSFLDSVEVSGWVSASYNYNLDDYKDGETEGANAGGDVLAHPFHPDTNTFSFDQLWFELERPVSEQQPAGFRADITYGKTAGFLSSPASAASGNEFEVYQAYVQYLANGVTWKAGKFATLIGAEVAQAPSNFNITRGQVYNLFQPITHAGVLAGGSLGGLDWNFGVVNGTRNFPASDVDDNTNKAVLFSIGRSLTDTLSVSLAGTYGEVEYDSNSGKEGILDLIVSFEPTDNLSIYLNADYIKSEDALTEACGMLATITLRDRGALVSTEGEPAFEELKRDFEGSLDDMGNPSDTSRYVFNAAVPCMTEGANPVARDPNTYDTDGFGVAVAGRLAVADSTGVSLRAEYVDIDNYFDAGVPLEMYTLTATVDHELATGLMLRAELRYDGVEDAGPDAGDADVFGAASGDPSPSDSQVVAGVELIYSF